MNQGPSPYRPRRASLYTTKRSTARRWRWVGWAALVAVILTAGAFTYVLWTVRDLPDPGQSQVLGGSIYIYDRNGRQIEQRNANGQYYEQRSEEHTSELQSQSNLVCRLL